MACNLKLNLVWLSWKQFNCYSFVILLTCNGALIFEHCSYTISVQNLWRDQIKSMIDVYVRFCLLKKKKNMYTENGLPIGQLRVKVFSLQSGQLNVTILCRISLKHHTGRFFPTKCKIWNGNLSKFCYFPHLLFLSSVSDDKLEQQKPKILLFIFINHKNKYWK